MVSRLRHVKDRSRWSEYWLTNISFQAAKNILQSLLSPLGAVLGALLTNSVKGAVIGYNLAEVSLNACVEGAAMAYARK